MATKFDTLDEVQEERQKLDEQYDNGLPDYLIDYFDKEERKKVTAEFFREKYTNKNSFSVEERKKLVKDREKDFWENNDYELVKIKTTARLDYGESYEEAPTADERIDQEESLSKEEIKYLISMCSDDLYLYGVRYFPHYLKRPSGKFHKFLYNTLTRELSFKNLKKKDRRGFKWAIAAPRGNAKCLCQSTEITIDKNTKKTIKNIQVGEEVLSLDSNFKFIQSKVIAKEHSGSKNCLEISTETGKTIKLTPEHKVLTFSGWKRTKNLTLKDRIASPKKTIFDESNPNSLGADIFWDRIISIEDFGICDTYDIQIENTENFISEGLITHNSSLISNILPLWCICYEKKKFIIIVSDTSGQAEDFLSDIKRELLSNAALARDFPHVVGKGPVWRQDEIITNNDIRIIALGTGSKVRGRKYGTDRPDLIIGDDLENSDMIRSKKERSFVRYSWFDKDLLFAGGADGTGTDFFIVGTVLSKDSLLNALLDPNEYPGWNTRRFSAVINHSISDKWTEWEKIYKDRLDLDREKHAREFFEENKEEMMEGVEVLWPEGDPYYNLMEYYVSNPSGYFSEKQNMPFDPSKIYVTKEELTFEYFTSPKIEECIKRGINRRLVFGGLDPSLGKKNTTGDYSAIVTLVRDPLTGLIFVIDIDVKRRKVDDQIETILKYQDKRHYKLFGVETNAFQYVVSDELRKLSKKRGIYVPIEEINQYTDKKLRIEGIVPFLKDGTFVFDKRKAEYNQMYNLGIEQITTYTGEDDTHDDVPDVLEMVFRIAKKNKFRLTTK